MLTEQMAYKSVNTILMTFSVCIVLLYAIDFIKKKEKNELLNIILENYKFLWYIFIISLLFIYCVMNWNKVIVLFPFNGNGLLFIILLILSILPFFKRIKIPYFSADIDLNKNFKHTENLFKDKICSFTKENEDNEQKKMMIDLEK
jgi:hypothetical protein